MNSFYFRVLEAIGFLLPALPPSLKGRLVVVVVYFALHAFGAPQKYLAFKQQFRRKTYT